MRPWILSKSCVPALSDITDGERESIALYCQAEVQVPHPTSADPGGGGGSPCYCWVWMGVQASMDTTLAGRCRNASLLFPTLFPLTHPGVALLPLGSHGCPDSPLARLPLAPTQQEGGVVPHYWWRWQPRLPSVVVAWWGFEVPHYMQPPEGGSLGSWWVWVSWLLPKSQNDLDN